MRAFRKYSARGFTLVELMIVVAIIGVLAALAIFGVNRYLKSAKTSEAKNAVGRISRGAQEAYERENSAQEMVALGNTSSAASHELCRSSTPVPMDGSVPAGKKYVPNNSAGSDFNTGTSSSGWKCLRFTIDDPIYFAYLYLHGGGFLGPGIGGPVIGPAGFEASARGDLDADGVTSVFTLAGQVEPSTGTLNRTTQIFIYEEFE